jgi:hypothetical protein
MRVYHREAIDIDGIVLFNQSEGRGDGSSLEIGSNGKLSVWDEAKRSKVSKFSNSYLEETRVEIIIISQYRHTLPLLAHICMYDSEKVHS